jgi:hypothetical protein
LAQSGAGAEVTALAESLQAYVCAARQVKRKPLEHIGELLNHSPEKHTVADRKLSACIESLDAGWMHSVIVTANKIFSDFGITTGYKFHRGSPLVEEIYAEFRKFKKASGITGEDKWNPADIWAAKANFKFKSGFSSIEELNAYMFEKFKSKELIGISLKKIPKGIAKTKIFNDGKPLTAKLEGVKIGTDVTASKDVYLKIASSAVTFEVQLRNFSSRPDTSTWQGEIKGKSAAGGKIGGGILYRAAIDSKVSPSDLMQPSAFKPHITNPSAQVIDKFATMFKELSGTTDSKKTIVDKTKLMIKSDPTWWMSKYLGVHYAYAVMKSKNKDGVANTIYSYASSATKFSSIFVKYSD